MTNLLVAIGGTLIILITIGVIIWGALVLITELRRLIDGKRTCRHCKKTLHNHQTIYCSVKCKKAEIVYLSK